MDFALAPAILRRESVVPYADMSSPMQPVRADPDMGYLCWEYRMAGGVLVQLEWLALGTDAGVLRATLTNPTTTTWPVALNWLARLTPPNVPPPGRLEEASGIKHDAQKGHFARRFDVALPEGAIWVSALHYERFEWGTPRYDDHLVFDGRRRGEIFDDGFVGSTGLGQGFGQTPADFAQWRFEIPRDMSDALLLIRYRMRTGRCTFRGGGLASGLVTLQADATTDCAFQFLELPVGRRANGDATLSLIALGGQAVELDGFVLVERRDRERVGFTDHDWGLKPDRQDDISAGQTILAFPRETRLTYGLAWTGGSQFVHGVQSNDIRDLGEALNDPSLFEMGRLPPSQGPGYVTIATPKLVNLLPGQTVVRDAYVAVGEATTLPDRLKRLAQDSHDSQFVQARERFLAVPGAVAKTFQEGADRLTAGIATNLLFPIWTGGLWVRNYCPGREWPSVYTWDSGFTGLGLARVAPQKSVALLDTYLSPIDDEQAAFLHHGTPLPTQFYLFQELWNRNGDVQFARDRYPKLARYLRFLLGRETGSTCRDLRSGLIRTYDYFYNTGGMDDYPAQMAVHAGKLSKQIAPVISSAHVIRCAKILCQVAEAVDARDDLLEWQRDIVTLSEALQTLSWDEASGYFAYVKHDAQKNPVGHFQNDRGENWNMGLDGVSPLVADICTPAQTRRLVDNLMTPGRLWTPSGITAVDGRASYASSTGYWNGTVWMPHQWFMWKALLDLGDGENAWQIARTALDVYSREVARSGRTYENFDAQTGVGGAWHPFGALSSPIRNWFESYCVPGSLTVGLNTLIARQTWTKSRAVSADLRISGTHMPTVLAVLDRPATRVTWQGHTVSHRVRADHCVEIVLTPGEGRLEIG